MRGGLCHAIHQYPGFNNKYMKGYEKNKKIVTSKMLGYK